MNVDSQSGKSPEPGAGVDELETMLRRQRFRGLPPEWRDVILERAVAGAAPARATAGPRRPRQASGGWEAWMSGWTLVAAAWALVFLLHAQSTPVRDAFRPPLPPLSAAALAELAAQRAALGEIST